MSTEAFVRLYPRAWRERYGDELAELIRATSANGPSWRIRADLVRAAARERLRAAGLADDPPRGDRTRTGVLLALCAWAAFVVAGVVVQRVSEHWQLTTPRDARAVPAAAFDVLFVGACIGTAFVLAGVAVAGPSLVRFLDSARRDEVRRPVGVAVALTLVAVPVSLAVVAWATPRSAAVVAWALFLLACLAAWTVAGVAIARRLDLSRGVLRAEALLAAGVATSMAVMTVATVVWWVGVGHTSLPTAAAAALMAGATLLAEHGARLALGRGGRDHRLA